jgi:hypothetical protein
MITMLLCEQLLPIAHCFRRCEGCVLLLSHKWYLINEIIEIERGSQKDKNYYFVN